MLDIVRRISAGVLIVLLFFISFSCASGSSKSEDSQLVSLLEMEPIPNLNPREVVEIQLSAFKANDFEDRGIALAYRFASPRNKRFTGTVENFASMVRQEQYIPMLNGVEFELGPMELRGDLAMVAVRIDLPQGTSTGYIFVLSRQKGGSLDNCWMTDGVMLVGPSRQKSLPPVELIES